MAVFGFVAVLCLAVAVYSYGKRLCAGLPRQRGRKTLFQPLDAVDEASVELAAAYSDADIENDDANFSEDGEEKQRSPSGMRMNVLTSMM